MLNSSIFSVGNFEKAINLILAAASFSFIEKEELVEIELKNIFKARKIKPDHTYKLKK